MVSQWQRAGPAIGGQLSARTLQSRGVRGVGDDSRAQAVVGRWGGSSVTQPDLNGRVPLLRPGVVADAGAAPTGRSDHRVGTLCDGRAL